MAFSKGSGEPNDGSPLPRGLALLREQPWMSFS
jgi:hypothetical protein